MRVCPFVLGQAQDAVEVDCDPEITTVAALHRIVAAAASHKLGHPCQAKLIFNGATLQALSQQLLYDAGITKTANVHAVILSTLPAPMHEPSHSSSHELTSEAPPPRCIACAPAAGLEHESTVVRVHGEGFTTQRGFGSAVRHLSWAGARVPFQRESDRVLVCLAPPHVSGIVDVKLFQCGRGGPSSTSEAEGVATFEYVRREARYDAIFASTNAFCPQRSVGSSGAPGSEEEAAGDSSSLPSARWGS